MINGSLCFFSHIILLIYQPLLSFLFFERQELLCLFVMACFVRSFGADFYAYSIQIFLGSSSVGDLGWCTGVSIFFDS